MRVAHSGNALAVCLLKRFPRPASSSDWISGGKNAPEGPNTGFENERLSVGGPAARFEGWSLDTGPATGLFFDLCLPHFHQMVNAITATRRAAATPPEI